MKYLLILFTTLFMQQVQAQKSEVQITAQSKTLKVDLENEDADNAVTINSKLKSAATGSLVITKPDAAKDKDWKRTFTIYNDADQSMLNITPCKTAGKYSTKLKTILSKLKPGQSYSLYTMAIPKDPKKAALVRVRRVFVCKIAII